MAMTKRTHMCGEIVTSEVGKQVILKGWVQRAPQPGRLNFREHARPYRHCAGDVRQHRAGR